MLEPKNKYSVYDVEIKQNHSIGGQWSYVGIELLNANKEYLFSFGDEMWYETGYDSEGSWREYKNKYSTKITIPDKGKFFFKVNYENAPTASSIPFDLSPFRFDFSYYSLP